MNYDQSIQPISNITNNIISITDKLINNFYPSYNKPKSAEHIKQEDSYDMLNSFTFYKLSECCIYDVDDKVAYLSEKMKNVFKTAYAINQPICYGVTSQMGETSLLIGVPPTNDANKIKSVFEGILSGIKLEKFEDGFVNSKDGYGVDKGRYVGCVSGTPVLKVEDEYKKEDLTSLMRSLNGQNYTIMVLCNPVSQLELQNKISTAMQIKDESFALTKRTLSHQEGTSNSEASGTSNSSTYSKFESKSTMFGVGGGLGFMGMSLGLSLGFARTRGHSQSETKGYSNTITNSINNSNTTTGDVQNSFAIQLMGMADNMLNRLMTGSNIGVWHTLVSYSTDDLFTKNIIEGSLQSKIACDIPDILPPVTFSYESHAKDKFGHNQQLMIPENFFNGRSELFNFATSEELCGICTIPVENTVGFTLKEAKGYTLNYLNEDSSTAQIGSVCEYNKVLENIPFGLSEYDLNKHTFVCGITGSGKTNTVKAILENTNKPFLVIEPAKKEYRNINKDVTVYTLGRPEINSIQTNPFYILPGLSPLQHIDLLKELFNASFALYGPMPNILEKCLLRIYEKKGWNLMLGFHPYLVDSDNFLNYFSEEKISEFYNIKSHINVFPTMLDLKDTLDDYIENETTYEGEVKGNIRGAMQTRIDALCVGSKGYMFNTNKVIDFKSILEKNTVLELEGLADDSDKSFALGLLLIYISEYRQVQKEVSSTKGLKHLLVIEEAHRLLENVSKEKNVDLGNPKGKAVEHFTNMLAEMRSYGQGVIVAEQIPTKLAVDVIKNSSNKIVHRIVARDDQEVVANTIGLHSKDAIYLGNNKTGYALSHKEGMVEPVLVKFNEVENNIVLDVKLLDQNVDEKVLAINQSSLKNAIPKLISNTAITVLCSIMYGLSDDDIYDGLENIYEQLNTTIISKKIVLIFNKDKKDLLLQCLIEEIISLLTLGVFSIKKLPDNQLIELVTKVVKRPVNANIDSLNNYLEKCYYKSTENKVIEVIAGLYHDRINDATYTKNAIDSYLLVKNSNLFEDVIDYIIERSVFLHE